MLMQSLDILNVLLTKEYNRRGRTQNKKKERRARQTENIPWVKMCYLKLK